MKSLKLADFHVVHALFGSHDRKLQGAVLVNPAIEPVCGHELRIIAQGLKTAQHFLFLLQETFFREDRPAEHFLQKVQGQSQVGRGDQFGDAADLPLTESGETSARAFNQL